MLSSQGSDYYQIRQLNYSLCMCLFTLMTEMGQIWDEWLQKMKHYWDQAKDIWLNA